MSDEWRVSTLDQLGPIITGKTPPTRVDGCFGGNVPFVTPRDFDERRLISSTERCLTDKGAELVSRSRIPANAVMVTCIGSDMGKTALATNDCITNQQINSIVVESGNDPLFVYYNLSNRKEEIRSSASGSAQPILNKSAFGNLEILLPPFKEQQAIACILGALDDKIELNRRMNRTLEDMARAIFKSWFVDFDPVRAKASGNQPAGLIPDIAALFPDSFEDSELGEIPDGWEIGKLDRALSGLVSGSRPKGGSVNDGVPSIGAENIVGLGQYDFSKEKFVPEEHFKRLKLKGANVRDGDVLLYKDGAHIGRKTYFDFGFPHTDCAVNEHVFILRTKRQSEQRYLYFWLDQLRMTNEIIALNSNSAQPGINQAGVRGLPMLFPGENVVDEFDKQVLCLLRRLFADCNESRTLSALRDILLPELISGELRVPDAERIIGRYV